MSKYRPVGVLGGMGPEATILLQQRLLACVDAVNDDSHIPLLIDMNPQVPSRLDWLLHDTGENPGPVLADMAYRLEQSGARALAMPCNTAHHFATEITGAVDIPLINMVSLASRRAAELCDAGDQVGILASPATQKINLFQNALAEYQLNALYPTDSNELLSSIIRIKLEGDNPLDRQILSDNASKLVQQGARCLFVGCSEFSIIADAIQVEIPVIDTLDLLAEKIIAFSSG